jgi:UDP-2-acetamido-2,6-beta-L-arabino-hexul-4-ose reductase
MKTVLVTGSEGFIGKNLVTRLTQDGSYTILSYDKNTDEDLGSLVNKTDFIFHLAGVNRPQNEKEFKTGNQDFTDKILELATPKKIPVLVTSSIQALLDNAYGKSKRGAEDLIAAYGKKTGAKTYIFRLPNVFGKWSRPNYNSAVATFCYNIAHDLPVQINDAKVPLTLVYIDEVIDEFLKCLSDQQVIDAEGFCYIPMTYTTTVGKLAGTIKSLHAMRSTAVVPDLSDKLTKYLHATLTSFYEEDALAHTFELHDDERGWLFELVKSTSSGQVFISNTKPGYTRGQHWHHTKVERFCVIKGTGEIKFRKINSKETFSYPVTDTKTQIVDIPVGYIHSITNTGSSDMLLVIWANEILDKEHPDTYYEQV